MNKQLRHIVLLGIALLSAVQFTSAEIPDTLLFRDYIDLHRMELQMHERFHAMGYEAGLDQLYQLESEAEKKGDDRLRDFMRMLRYRHAQRFKQTNNRYVEEGFLSLLKTMEKSNDPLRAEVMYHLSQYYFESQLFSSSFEYGLLAHKIYTNYSVSEFPLKSSCLHDLGGHFYLFRDFESSKRYFLEICKEEKPVSSINTLALCYSQLNMHDSALHYFTVSHSIAKKEKNEALVGILSGNIGHLYYLQRDYRQSVHWFDLCIAKCLEHNIIANAANAMSELAIVYLELKEPAKAHETALRAYTIISGREYHNAYDLVKNAYPKIAKVFALNGRTRDAYRMLDSANTAKDSVNRRSNALIFAGVQHKLDAEEHLESLQKHEKEERIQLLVRNGLMGGLLLLGVIAALLINRQRLKYRHHQEQLQVEKLQAQAELINATSQLEDFTKSLSEKNELIEKFGAEIQRMQLQHGSGENLTAPLHVLQKSTILSENEWERFQNNFEKVHRGFLKRLKQKVHGLSPVETRFMLLSRLRLSNQEMASALGISTEAARQNRERLKAKLRLENEEHSLEEFAARI